MNDPGVRRINRLVLLLIAGLGLVGCAALGGIVATLWARAGQEAAALELASDLANARTRFGHVLGLLDGIDEDAVLESRDSQPQVVSGAAVCIRGSAERLLQSARGFEAITAGYASMLEDAGLARVDAPRPTFRSATIEVRLVPPGGEDGAYGVYLTFAEPSLAACLR